MKHLLLILVFIVLPLALALSAQGSPPSHQSPPSFREDAELAAPPSPGSSPIVPPPASLLSKETKKEL